MSEVSIRNLPEQGELIWYRNWSLTGERSWELVLWLHLSNDPNNRYGTALRSCGEIRDTFFMGNLYRGDNPADI